MLNALGSIQIEASRSIKAWFALEYPGHLVADKSHLLELRINSDVAGAASGIIDWSKESGPHDPYSAVTTNPDRLSFPQLIDLSGAKFMYWSDIQNQLEDMRIRGR